MLQKQIQIQNTMNSSPRGSTTPIRKDYPPMVRSTMNNIWRQSSTSMTRNRSPCHRIPQAPRFTTSEVDKMNSSIFVLLDIVKCSNAHKSPTIRFPKSKRPEHFIKKFEELTPSAATYNKVRFMDDVQYKTIQLQPDSPLSTKGKLYMCNTIRHNLDHHKKGVTIRKFRNYSKLYLPQGKNLPYQPEVTMGNPGVGQYDPSPEIIIKPFKSQSFRINLRHESTAQSERRRWVASSDRDRDKFVNQTSR